MMGAIFDRTGAYDDGFILYICLGLAALLMVPRLRVVAVGEDLDQVQAARSGTR
jgi:hypothetical protein